MGVWHDMSFLRCLTVALSLGLASARCPESWWTFGNSCYHNSGATMTWAEARAYCRGIEGGYLGEIESEEEEQTLVGAFAIYDQDYWIGLTDQDSEGEWVWAVLIDGYKTDVFDRPVWLDVNCETTDMTEF